MENAGGDGDAGAASGPADSNRKNVKVRAGYQGYLRGGKAPSTCGRGKSDKYRSNDGAESRERSTLRNWKTELFRLDSGEEVTLCGDGLCDDGSCDDDHSDPAAAFCPPSAISVDKYQPPPNMDAKNFNYSSTSLTGKSSNFSRKISPDVTRTRPNYQHHSGRRNVGLSEIKEALPTIS